MVQTLSMVWFSHRTQWNRRYQWYGLVIGMVLVIGRNGTDAIDGMV